MGVNLVRILFARTGLVAWLLALVCAPALLAAQEPPKTLAITEVLPIPVNGPSHSEDTESLYYRVEVTYPQDWQDEVENTFKVEVDGHPATCETTGAALAAAWQTRISGCAWARRGRRRLK